MTVKELIKILKQYPKGAVVCGEDNEQGEFEIDYVKLSNMPKDCTYIHNSGAKKIVLLT